MKAAPKLPWWQTAAFYQVYPRSFADSNGDGVGDLAGLRQKLPYLADLGVNAVWISPFFASPQRDFGYDVADYLSVAPEYGTLDDVRTLIDEAHALGLRVVFDLVLNHTSDQHPWFEASRRRDPAFADWYIWRDKPTNWRSLTGGKGWHWDDVRKAFYWASFLSFQPDLNWRNPDVRKAMFDMVRHWLEAGVDGFRLDIFNSIYKDAAFRPNGFAWQLFPSEENPLGLFQKPTRTLNLPENIQLAKDLRQLVDGYPGDRMLIGESFGPMGTLREYLGNLDTPGLNLVFAFKTLTMGHKASSIRKAVNELEAHFAPPTVPVYVFGNHDRVRSRTMLGGRMDRARLRAMLQLTLRGVPFVYYGEEVGMLQHNLPLDTALDPIGKDWKWVPNPILNIMKKQGLSLNRDECRTPMPWASDSPNAGFCPIEAKPWLPLEPHFFETNVQAQQADDQSLWCWYRKLLQLRKESPALNSGSFCWLEGCGPANQLLAWERTALLDDGSSQTFHLYLNTNDRACKIVPKKMGTLLLGTHKSKFEIVRLESYVLAPNEGWLVQVD